ncbi:unnamed protein product [Prorocentrum cordatum]|uniref:Alpha/beta hydrolase fold-3 domain-containing protein n=1 Tax=Prorocentrum cordatum TaxID=2364126 RepID=A0ABN9TC71_9DINO|nr:unnamed protein product [Polarella glacialis]
MAVARHACATKLCVQSGSNDDTQAPATRAAYEIRCARAIRAWKESGYQGEALNDSEARDDVELTELSPEETGFATWVRSTGNPAAYLDPDGTPRGTATLAVPMSGTPDNFVALYLHGGGYRKYKPTDGYVAAVSTWLAAVCVAPVLTIDYRLAPEFDAASHAAIDDVHHALHWLRLRYPAAKIFVIGDSAGAGLALSSTYALLTGGIVGAAQARVHPPDLPAGLCLLSPYIDLTMNSPGFENAMFNPETGSGDIFYTNHDGSSNADTDRDWLRNRAMDYIGHLSPDDPLCSPTFIPDAALARFPPILALVGGAEVFLQETWQFIDRAVTAGARAKLMVFDRMWHDWFNFCNLPSKIGTSGGSTSQHLSAAVEAYEALSAWVRSLSFGGTYCSEPKETR